MLNALFKMILITLATLLLSFLGVIFIRWLGAHQGFEAPPHPWFKLEKWDVTRAPCAVDKSVVPSENAIFLVEVRREKDQWVVKCPNSPLLTDWLTAQPINNWILQVKAIDTWGLDDLVSDLDKLGSSKKFAVWSESQKVAVYLRKKAPQWLFAADSGMLLRFQLFKSLWIEPAVDFWPDFVVVTAQGGVKFDERATEYLHSRKKRILWLDSSGPIPSDLAVDGRIH